jgi:hypothetical protein
MSPTIKSGIPGFSAYKREEGKVKSEHVITMHRKTSPTMKRGCYRSAPTEEW